MWSDWVGGFAHRLAPHARGIGLAQNSVVLWQAVRTAALVLGVVATFMLAVLFFDNLWWSVLTAALRLRSRLKGEG